MAHNTFLGEETFNDGISVLGESCAFRLATCGQAVISGVDDGVVGQLHGIDVTFVGVTHLAPDGTLHRDRLTMDVFSDRNFQSVHLLGKAEGETLLQHTREAGDAVPRSLLEGLSFRSAKLDLAAGVLGTKGHAGQRVEGIWPTLLVKRDAHVARDVFAGRGVESDFLDTFLMDGEPDAAAEVVEGERLKGLLGSIDHRLGKGEEGRPVKASFAGRLDRRDRSLDILVCYSCGIIIRPVFFSGGLIGIHCPEIIPALYPSVGVVAHAAGKIGCLGRGAEGRGEFFLVQEVHFDGVAVFPEDGAILLKDGFGGIAFTGGTDGKEGGFLLHGYFLAGTGCKGKKCRKNIYSLFHGFQSLMVTSNLLHRFLRCRRRQALP